MTCRICGSTKSVKYRNRSNMALCGYCHKDTPAKVSFTTFIKMYFGDDSDVPQSTKGEFYSDYKTSTHNLQDYILATTTNL